MKKVKKVIFVYIFEFLLILNNSYAGVQSELQPLENDIKDNFTSLTTTIIIMLGVFAILGIIYKITDIF